MESLSCRKDLIFFVNGIKVVEQNPLPDVTLLYYLRNKLGLKGTKLGCGQGGCGACTVMVSRYNRVDQRIRHYSICACLTLLCSVDGLSVTTVEGIGSVRSLHPVQERIAKSHGSQCGFCTPGMVMSMYTLLRNNPQPSQAEVERAFDGNLCRCTGYRPILDGYKTFTKEFCCGQPSGSSKCCKDDTTGVISGSFALFDPKEFKSLDPTQEPIFPPELQVADLPQPLFIRGPLTEWEHEGQKRTHQALWIRPVTLDELLDAKHMYPDGKIVAGSTQISVDMKVNKLEYTTFIDPLCVPELTSVKENKDGVLIGASCSLNQIADRFSILVDKLPSYKTQALQAVLDMLCLFEGDQVKNAASMGGGLMIASPISDLNPILMSMGAEVTIASKSGGCRTAMIDDKFFVSHHKVAVEKEEVLVSISIPFTKESEHIIAYRPPQKRREESICDVNASFRIEFESNNNKEVVRSAHLVFGGCGSMIKKARKTEETITGESWDNSLLEKALESIPLDLASSPDGATGGNARYQETLSKSYFYKFYMTVLGRTMNSVPPAEATINLPSSRLLTKSCLGFQDVPLGQPSDDTIGRPVPHLSSVQHSTGTAVYIDDMPKYKNELYCGIVRSQRAHARVIGVDTSEAISIPGVWGYTGAGDIQGQESNSFAVAGVPDEVIFAEEVTYQGQTIGVVLADEEILAQRASSRVKVAYQDLPSLLSIEEAIEANSFYDYKREVIKGSVTDGFAQSDHIVTGEVHIGGQEHFYMETQAILVIPKEDGEMEIFSSTQSANGIQMQVARVTGVPSHKIRVRVKRVGGAFGGKTTAPIALACTAALAAKRSGRPVRVMLDRQEDLMSTGTRHPFLAKYKVGCTSDGKIKSAQVEVFCNGGSTQDLSGAFMEKCLCQIDNAYCIPNWHAVGRVCKTNIRSPTNFRGFGAPQAVFLAEYLIAKVAQICGLDPTRVQYHNLYHDGDSTHLNQKLVDCHLQQCWDELMKKSDFEDRKRKANNYNLENRWIKHGLAVVPVKCTMFFGALFLNQGGALVHVYTDGTVLLSHGGVEMGQGLHTKTVQICSRALGIPHSKIHVSEMATSTVPNATATAASMSTDIYGMAVKNACEEIKGRLSPYMESNPKGTWEDWVKSAYLDRINLSANGFYKIEDMVQMDWVKNEGNLFSYYVYGAACSEVEVDLLTGDHKVLRTDIVMDVGESLNPAIDIGQIEGAFVQGYGMYMMEEPLYYVRDDTKRGTLLTAGPGSYKIPRVSNIPSEFNVSLLKGVPNKRAIYSSKAVGEPPLPLASSIFFAVHDVIASARREAGLDLHFRLDSPATSERIRMTGADNLTKVE